MAQKIIYTCDICKKDMPEDGAVIVIHHPLAIKEKGWDVCDACHKSILQSIQDMTKEK